MAFAPGDIVVSEAAGIVVVAWDNGTNQADIPEDALRRFSGSDIQELLSGHVIHVIGEDNDDPQAQEARYFIVEVFELENAAGNNEGSTIVWAYSVGRGNDIGAVWAMIEVGPEGIQTLDQLSGVRVQPLNRFPRY